MEPWLKGLVATACVVVIGWGGYLGWNEFDRQMTLRRAAQADQALAEIAQARRADAEKKQAEAAANREQLAGAQRKAGECHSAANWLRNYAAIEHPKDAPPKADLISKVKECAAQSVLNVDDLADMKPYL